ncbi:MAG: PKD domain-containing protein, partial [Halobacteriovoraceae bacterium]|nr:PKD domain-containing protein [Halobacteriovoraceae bacterium]
PYSVTLTAVGENGEEFSNTETIDVIGSSEGYEFPIADFRVETESWAPGVRLYVDQSLSPIAPIKTFLWDLGDGTFAYGSEIIHFYQAGGYDVTLTAILEDGSQSVVEREVIVMNNAPNMVANIDCFDVGNLNLECEVIAVDKFSELTNINIHFGDTEILPENIISQSVSGQLAEVVFTHPYNASGTYNVTYQVQTERNEEIVSNVDFQVSEAQENLPPEIELFCFPDFMRVDCYTGLSYDPDGFIINYEFDFGGLETISGVNDFSSFTFTEEGMYQITLTATDNLGATSTTSVTVPASFSENVPPVAILECEANDYLQLTCSGANSFDPDGEILRGSLFALETGENLQTDNLNELSFTFNFETAGSKAIVLNVEDNRNFNAEVIQSEIVISNESPLADFECISRLNGLDCDGSASIDQDGLGSIVSYEWSLSGQTLAGQNVSFNNLTQDRETVNLKVTDNTGLEDVLSKEFDIILNLKPSGSFACTSSEPQRINCTTNFTDPNGEVVNYSWRIGEQTFSGETLDTLIDAQGLVEVFLKVTDDFGDFIEQSQNVSIVPNNAPEARISIDRNGKVFPATFSLSGLGSTDTDGNIQKYSWKLPNGSTVESSTLEYSISTASQDTIELTVEDNLGLTDTRAIIVVATEPPSSNFNITSYGPDLPSQIAAVPSKTVNSFG